MNLRGISGTSFKFRISIGTSHVTTGDHMNNRKKRKGPPTINYRGRFYGAFLNTNQTRHRTSHHRISELRLHPFGGLLRPPLRHGFLTLSIERSTLESCVFSPRINPYLCTPNTTRPIRFRCYTDIVHTINLFPCVL